MVFNDDFFLLLLLIIQVAEVVAMETAITEEVIVSEEDGVTADQAGVSPVGARIRLHMGHLSRTIQQPHFLVAAAGPVMDVLIVVGVRDIGKVDISNRTVNISMVAMNRGTAKHISMVALSKNINEEDINKEDTNKAAISREDISKEDIVLMVDTIMVIGKINKVAINRVSRIISRGAVVEGRVLVEEVEVEVEETGDDERFI